MAQKECKTCRSTGEIVRGHDGRKIRCTTCLGEINHRRDIPRKSQSNEQTRIELTEYGIRLEHPPACTCVDCNNARQDRLNKPAPEAPWHEKIKEKIKQPDPVYKHESNCFCIKCRTERNAPSAQPNAPRITPRYNQPHDKTCFCRKCAMQRNEQWHKQKYQRKMKRLIKGNETLLIAIALFIIIVLAIAVGKTLP